MEDLLVSVIVTAYNVEKYIDECIESIVNQSYKNLEIIIVDDGSPDSVPQKCDAWRERDTRIKVIHKTNGGVSSAKNLGVAAATGELIGFVDGDDCIALNYYETLVNALKKNESDIVRMGMERIDENGKFINRVIPKKASYSGYEALQCIGKDDGIFIMNQLSLSKREVFENISFPEGRVCEDAAVAHQFYMKIKKLTVLPYDLYRYRIVSQSIMHKKIVIKRLDIIEALYDRFLSYQNSGYIELLADTCNIAKNKMWILGRIKFITKADKVRKQQIIKMYRYMYRNVDKPVSIQCTLCYFFPYLYNKMRERLKFKRNFMHVL